MKIKKKPLKIIFKRFNDNRGYLTEIYSKKKININFQRSIVSYSKKNVIRGLHFSAKSEYRLIFVLSGEINDFCFDLDYKKKIYKFNLKEHEGLLLPPSFVHGYECLGKNNLIIYHLTLPYKKKNNLGVIWNDRDLKINWSIKKPIISKNDKLLPSLKKLNLNK